MSQEIEEAVISLQTQVAFQDKLIDEMNMLIFRQQEQIDRMNHTVVKLYEKMHSGSADTIKQQSEETPPPHY